MSENKKILVTDFVKAYNQLKSGDLKTKKIKNIIKRTYCPVLEKRAMLNIMLEKSVVEDGTKHVDMFINRINFIATIIALYTNLETERHEDGKPKTFEMYDLLVENDILNGILSEIGQREIEELTSINGVVLDNWYAQNTSTEAYLNNLVGTATYKFGVAAGAGMDKLADVLGDEAKMAKIMPMLEKMIKKIK